MDFKNQTAENFYNELIQKNIVEKNEEVRIRLVEVVNWQEAFQTIMKHANYFKLNIIKKEILIDILKKYGLNFKIAP